VGVGVDGHQRRAMDGWGRVLGLVGHASHASAMCREAPRDRYFRMARPRTPARGAGAARHRHARTSTSGEDPTAGVRPNISDMIESVGRRLRIVFGRGRSEATRSDPSGSRRAGQELEFVAYGEDCLLSGLVRMSSDRLTDMLNEHDEYVLGDVL